MKFCVCHQKANRLQSRPARGAWAEILLDEYDVENKIKVAPRKGRVG